MPSVCLAACWNELLCFSLRFHAERAIDIITHILPEDHLLLASSKRVKGKPGQPQRNAASWVKGSGFLSHSPTERVTQNLFKAWVLIYYIWESQ